jgi:hypothetical protein
VHLVLIRRDVCTCERACCELVRSSRKHNLRQPDRSAIKPAAMEAKGIRLQGERGISRQTIAQGMPECSGCTCMLVCAFLCTHCTRDRGCSKHPAFPAPSVLRERNFSKPRAQVAPRERGFMSNAKRRHCERSEAIHSFVMPSHGLLRFARNDVDRPQRTGCPAFAGHDDLWLLSNQKTTPPASPISWRSRAGPSARSPGSCADRRCSRQARCRWRSAPR